MVYKIPTDVQRLGRDIAPEQLRYHTKRVLVAKEFTFDSAHHLHCYEGKCQNLHGHTYRVLVTMSGAPDERGLTIDFADMKRIAKSRIIDPLDHQYLNEVLPPMNTTAENMVVWMFEQLELALEEEGFAPRVRLEEVKLWETPTSYAAATRAMMEEL
ncbi:MAG: 6-carboxytetrahydropterin synthase QueD [Paenibacillaceae bacterium]|nr:6-carboxytetrahydropterin synthase QueD [Paenibacillaceae bacterium]